MSPSISAIITAYRAADTIRRAIDSVFAQSLQPVQVVVVDGGGGGGGSPDDLETALAPYGDRVTLLRKKNGGAASARNAGIDAAKGSYKKRT